MQIAIKEKLLQSISKITNPALLEELYRFLQLELEQPKEVYELSESEKSAVMEALNEYKRGELLDEKEANDEIDSWLKK